MEKYDNLTKESVDELIKNLPPIQQVAVKACISAAKVKSNTGRRYTKDWMYECILMRYKGPALYRKMQTENIIPLPSPRTIQRYLKKMRPAYGFQSATFDLLAKKAGEMEEAKRHGSLLMDEMKLTEGLKYDKASMEIEGFISLKSEKSPHDGNVAGDHALVLMFQPFRGEMFQTVGAFLTRGAMAGKDLAKLALDAITRLHQCGFYVDVIVTDGAPWNRTMWTEFGIVTEEIKAACESEEWGEDEVDFSLSVVPESNTENVESRSTSKSSREAPKEKAVRAVSCNHPYDAIRNIWFVSDFPHLIKSVKERLLKKEVLHTPDGTVNLSHWKVLLTADSKRGIRLAPKLNQDHFQKEGYLAMRVKLAFSMFSEEVASAMEHYSKSGIKGLENCAASVKFIRRMNKLIEAMNSNSPSKSLRAKSAAPDEEEDPSPSICYECKCAHSEYGAQSKKSSRQIVEDFLDFLKKWEKSKEKRDRCLTYQTAYGLQVTLTSALELTDYLTTQVGYEYLMTKRINQDALEHFFGKARQACGSNTHPDPTQFVQIYRLLSVGSLIKPPRGSNITGATMLQSLMETADIFTDEDRQKRIKFEEIIDEALDSGKIIDEIDKALGDHIYAADEKIDDYALRPFAGYVARKARKMSTARNCDICFKSLAAPQDQSYQEINEIIHARSKGHLITPSNELFLLVRTMEVAIVQTLKSVSLGKNVLFKVLEHVKSQAYKEVGCEDHHRQLTKDIIRFYLNTRLIFACEEHNRYKSENAAKKRKAKQLLKLQRLTA